MSLRLEMLQVARLSPRALGESAGLVAAFLKQQQSPAGGFVDRGGAADLYYTVFGLDGLVALHDPARPAGIVEYLKSFATGDGLDFVHLACLARAWAAVSRTSPDVSAPHLLARIEAFRTADGGYDAMPGARSGTAYAAFLALGAYQDLRVDLPDPHRLVASIASLRSADGAYGNRPAMPVGQTSATAAAIAVQRQLDDVVDDALGPWMLAQLHPQGGFRAFPGAPAPDLLSTATALHALASLQQPLDPIRDACLDFVDSLWTNRGGFYGHWADHHLDCEYTYYGLLSLGHLSV